MYLLALLQVKFFIRLPVKVLNSEAKLNSDLKPSLHVFLSQKRLVIGQT